MKQTQAIAATGFDVTIQGDQPERSYAVIDAMLQAATLDPATSELDDDEDALVGILIGRGRRPRTARIAASGV